MPKFTVLKNRDLKTILSYHDLHTSGTKSEMVKRLTDALETDEINNDELVRLLTLPGENDDAVANPNDDEVVDANVDDNCVIDDDHVSVSSRTSRVYHQPQPQHKFSVNEISETIPVFDPTNEQAMTAEHFIDHVDSAMRAYNFDPKCLLLAVYSRLKGVARLWLDGQRTLFRSWDEFKDELLAEFGRDLDEAEINTIMTKAVRQTNEKTVEYCFKMQALGKRYGLSESATIKYTRNGLRNRELQNTIAITKFRTMRDMRRTIEEYENNIMSTPTKPSAKEPIKTPNNKAYPSPNAKPKTDIICYNCNEKGHISRNCTKPQRKERCSKCHRTTHQTENCTQSRENSAIKRENVNTVNESPDTYQDVIREVTADGRIIRAFLDSGSSLSLVREKCMKWFTKVAECDKMLNGFGGGKYKTQKKVTTNITIDGKTCAVDLYVVRDEDIPENLLLGRDVLCQKGMKFIIGHNTCQMVTVVSESKCDYSSSDQQAIDELLNANNACFTKNVADLGKCTTEMMEIKLSTDIPITLRPYRVPFAKRTIIDDIIKELLTWDIIRKSKSAYASPTVLVEKKNGEHRLCVDYRSLNKITIKKPFPMPILEEQFAQLSGNKYFTTLDLRMGYYQIQMKEQSKQFTAFVTTDGHYEFNRMPFGLVNAPAVFQQIMNGIIQEMPRGAALVYLDDIIIPSRTIDEGLMRLKIFFDILTTHGLKLRQDKCHYFQKEIEHLGHLVNENGIKPGPGKLAAVQDFAVPKNITEVRRFLGLTGFFRKFIRDYAIIAKPITQLLHKQRIDNFQWTTQQQQAFEKLIESLTSAPLLALYDMNHHHEVHTDACQIGLAGVLLQSTEGKSWKPVMYYSRHCTEAEQKYHSYELEVLAVVETLQRFRLQLLTKHFTLVTDCAAIAQTKTQTELKPRIARWWLRLQEFDFDTVHRAGNRLAHVDAMSRAPVEVVQKDERTDTVLRLEVETDDWIVALQQRDERARLLTNVLLKKTTSPEGTAIQRDYVLKGYRLYRKVGDGRRLYVPKAARCNLVRHFHDDMGHFGTEKTLQRISTLFWFPKMRKLVKEYVHNCISCCYNKQQRRRAEGELHYDAPMPIPFRVLHLDHLGPFVKSTRSNTHLLVIVDAFSKFTIVKAVRNTKTVPVINALNETIGYFGLPKKLITDRGTAFTARKFTEYCTKYEIQHVQTAVRTPRANGQVERMNAILLDMLRTSTESPNRWDEHLHTFQWVLNSQKNTTTTYSPNELVFKYNINNAVHNHLVAALLDDEHIPDSQPIQRTYDNVLENIAKARQKWKTRFDEKHSKPTSYREGELVVLKYEAPSSGESRKLEPRFRGPYVVKKILGNDRYLIANAPGLQKNRQFNSVYSADLMKPWCYGYPEVLEYSNECDDEDDESNAEDDAMPEHPTAELSADEDDDVQRRQSRRLAARKGRTVTDN